MHSAGRRKCAHCKEFFLPDARNRHHQRYCAQPVCRLASKAASQRRWESRPENHDCYRGPERAQKVRAWRAANPGYWKRRRAQPVALPDVLITQTPGPPRDAVPDDSVALPDLWSVQDPLLVGLIAHFAGVALPEDIALMTNRFVARGQALLGRSPYENPKTSPLSGTRATGAVAF